MNNTQAILLMTGAMACFALLDTFVKLLADTQSVGQILAISSLACFVVFAIWERRIGGRVFTREILNPILIIRTVGEVVGSVGILMALALAPLSTVTAMGQAQPLAVTMGGAIFLGEKVGWRRWVAVLLGFAGVLIILRPGGADFDPALLWVLLYIFGLAARDVASRALPSRVSTPFAVAWAMLPMGVFGVLLTPFQGGWMPVTPEAGVFYVCLVLSMVAALFMLTTGMRMGEVSAVAPFRYTRILFALFIAYVIFGEVPDFFTWAGAALIVGSGLYAFLRERRLKTSG